MYYILYPDVACYDPAICTKLNIVEVFTIKDVHKIEQQCFASDLKSGISKHFSWRFLHYKLYRRTLKLMPGGQLPTSTC